MLRNLLEKEDFFFFLSSSIPLCVQIKERERTCEAIVKDILMRWKRERLPCGEAEPRARANLLQSAPYHG
jgi:hypothetical protein